MLSFVQISRVSQYQRLPLPPRVARFPIHLKSNEQITNQRTYKNKVRETKSLRNQRLARERGDTLAPVPDSTILLTRTFPSVVEQREQSSVPCLTWQELKEMVGKDDVVLIDVRQDFAGEPPLPNHLHLPIDLTKNPETQFTKDRERGSTKEQQQAQIKQALMSPEQFKARFGKGITKQSRLIFYSTTGVRSEAATEAAIQMGFKSSKVSSPVIVLTDPSHFWGECDFGTSTTLAIWRKNKAEFESGLLFILEWFTQ